MENKNYFFNDVEIDLNTAFEAYYDLVFGFYDLEQHQELKIKELSKVVKNEVFEKGGKFYSLFQEIATLEDEIGKLEEGMNKNNDKFNIDESLSVQIKHLYYDAIKEISKLMFMYGVRYGKNFEKYLDNIANDFQKEEIKTRFEYTLDFSQNGYFNEEKDKDDNLDNLIKEALKESENQTENLQIDPNKIEKFSILKQKLYYIAVENSTLMKIKMLPNNPKVIIELESETLDFDTEELKNALKDVVSISKCVCLEAKTNGKILLTVEMILFKNVEK